MGYFFNYADNSKYWGNWKDGKKQGRGELISSSNKATVGQFYDNQFIKPSKENYKYDKFLQEK